VVFNNQLWVVFVANNNSQDLIIASSADGQTWLPANVGLVTNQSSSASPALAAWNGQLWIAFVAANGSNDILLCSSLDGQNWPAASVYTIESNATPSPPALASFQENLWLAYVDDTNNILLASSPYGQTWGAPAPVESQAADSAPAPFTNLASPAIAQKAAGSTWLSYCGHGNPQVWGGNGSFPASDVAPMQNLPGLPVVFAAGCQTSLFMTNTPWGNASIDTNGVTRGPFLVDPNAAPNTPGLVLTDQATNQQWGSGTPGCTPLPVATPLPNPINIANACWANPWLFDYAPGGGIAYFGDHCVAPDTYPIQIETSLLKAYLSSTGTPILGDLYLTAQRQYWAGPDSTDATTPGLSDYHGIPRLYLGWLVFFGDPSLRLPRIRAESIPIKIGKFGAGQLQHPIIIEGVGGTTETLPGDAVPPIVVRQSDDDEPPDTER
jgi:hypothetical protein